MNNYETRAGVPKPQLGTPQNWTFEQNTFFCRFWNLINMIQKINSVKHNFEILFSIKKRTKIHPQISNIYALFKIAEFSSIFYSSLLQNEAIWADDKLFGSFIANPQL